MKTWSNQSWCYGYKLSKEEAEQRERWEDQNWCEWAQMVITANGMMAITSDYGDYVYHWSWGGRNNCNDGDFREFVAGLSRSQSYLCEKFAGARGRDEIQLEETKKYVRDHIMECYRDGGRWTKEAHAELALINAVEHEDDLRNWVNETSICDAWEMISRDYDIRLKAVTRLCMPILCKLVREQLDAEKQAA